jgi:hypothetical protein
MATANFTTKPPMLMVDLMVGKKFRQSRSIKQNNSSRSTLHYGLFISTRLVLFSRNYVARAQSLLNPQLKYLASSISPNVAGFCDVSR